ncbi:hypothetical protein F4825DRAFT_463145 [Nemania diffusa]|nr:hypothetical protein F4825DRAFT_463145 [Nemania diffusa]
MDNHHHLSLTSPGPPGTHPPLDLYPFDHMSLPGNIIYTPRVHATGKHPLTRWATGDDEPWHPRNLASGMEDGSDQPMLSDMRCAQFIVTGQPNGVSEMMPQSDSGYGSYNHPSITNGSVCDDSFDANPETQSVLGGSMRGSLADVPFHMPDDLPKDRSLGSSWPPQIRVETLKCDFCDKPVKTKSELKKHDQRHKKPFKCDIKDCTRSEGFSTINDLDRHKRSVHPESQTAGNRYVCQIGPCKNKHKVWPRADNFKAHLKRVHDRPNVSDDDLQDYIHKQPTPLDEHQDNPRREAAPDFSEYPVMFHEQTDNWSSLIDVSHGMNPLGPPSGPQGEENLPLSSSPSGVTDIHTHHQQELYQETIESSPLSHNPIASSSHIQHNEFPHETESPESTLSSIQEQMIQVPAAYSVELQVADVDASRFSVLDESSEVGSENSPAHSLSDHLMKTDSSPPDSIKPEDSLEHYTGPINRDIRNLNETRKIIEFLENSGVVRDLGEMKIIVDFLDSSGVLGQFGYKKESPEEVVGIKKTEDDLAVIQSQTPCHSCPTCHKVFPRRCELKKHEKRHEKPYGCTTSGCKKRFGSKNDWKRHENTQHFMLEMWRCDEESCDRVFARRENLRVHLEKDHQISDQQKLEFKLETCRVGRNCEARFWCGFCRKIIEIKERGHQGRTERFDHIGEHFSGRNQDQKEIGDWKDFDSSQRSMDSPKYDSDDGDSFSSSIKTMKSQQSLRDGLRHSAHHPRPKRKQVDSNNVSNSKKMRVASRALVCVSCNYPCEHIPCDNCRR